METGGGRAITTLRRTCPGGGPDAQLGAVSFLHRFGSALNPHFHVHVALTPRNRLRGGPESSSDGLFCEESGGAVTFHEETHLSADHVHRLQRTLQLRVLRLFQRRGLLDEATAGDMLTWRAAGGFSLDRSPHATHVAWGRAPPSASTAPTAPAESGC